MAYKEALSPLSTPINDVLFVDTETAGQYKDFQDLPEQGKKVFTARMKSELGVDEDPLEAELHVLWRKKAAFYPEFAKIVCISLGKIKVNAEGKKYLHQVAIHGSNEADLLNEFNLKVQGSKVLCAHNGERFDFPMMAKRMLINRIPITPLLNTVGAKPWDTSLFDTLKMWQFTGMGYSSLDMICFALEEPTPKKDITGADIHRLYWDVDLPWERGDNLKKIAAYCNDDVFAMANIYLRIIGNARLELNIQSLIDKDPARPAEMS